MEYYLVIQKSPDYLYLHGFIKHGWILIMLIEGTQTWKSTYYMISILENSRKYNIILQWQKANQWLSGAKSRGRNRCNGAWGCFESNVLYLDWGSCFSNVCNCQKSLNSSL